MQRKQNTAVKLIRSLAVKTVPKINTTPVKRCDPVAAGTFIQSWLCAGWDDQQWDTELNDMAAAGLTTLILSDVATRDKQSDGGKWTLYYPSALPELSGSMVKFYQGDLLEKALQKCREHEIGVFLGMGGYADWDFKGGVGRSYTDFCALSENIAEEIYLRYFDRYSDTIKGWYFVPEFNNNWFLCLPYAKKFAEGVNRILKKLTGLNPALPLMMSPYYTKYNGAAGFEASRKFWSRFFKLTAFRPGDIFAPQDAVGAGWIDAGDSASIMQMYRGVVDGADKGVSLWANCENFAQSHRGTLFGPPKTENTAFIPADPERFEKQMQIVSSYADNIITFSFNHYYSPQTIGSRKFYSAYLDYRNCIVSGELVGKTD